MELFLNQFNDAIRTRHSVRKYRNQPIEPEKVHALREAVEAVNREEGLHVQLVLEEPKAFATGVWKYGQFSGVRNYFVMAGPRGKKVEERVGWCGEHLVLLAQHLGLNTCWVGLTYKKISGTFVLREEEVVHCVIALGYGENQGVQHPMRPLERFVEADGPMPDWFLAGMEAALLAPTAINQQRFKFILHAGNVVEARAFRSLAGYTQIDLGIVKHDFAVVAGIGNFRWKE